MKSKQQKLIIGKAGSYLDTEILKANVEIMFIRIASISKRTVSRAENTLGIKFQNNAIARLTGKDLLLRFCSNAPPITPHNPLSPYPPPSRPTSHLRLSHFLPPTLKAFSSTDPY